MKSDGKLSLRESVSLNIFTKSKDFDKSAYFWKGVFWLARLICFCNEEECFDLLLNKHLNKNSTGNSSINDRSVRTCGGFRVTHDELLIVLSNASGNDGNVLVIPGPSLNSWPTIESGTALDILKKSLPNQDLESLMKQNKPIKGEVSVIHIKGHNEMNINKIVVMPINSNEETDETLRRLYLDAVVKLKTDQDIGRQVYLVAPYLDAKKASDDIEESRANGWWICRQMAGALGANDKVMVVESANANKQTVATTEYYVDNIPDDTTAQFRVDGEWQEKATIQHSDDVETAIFSPDGHYIVTASADKTAKICELVGDEWHEKTTLDHSVGLINACFSSDGKHFVTVSDDNIAQIWELVEGKCKKKATIKHSDNVNSAIFSPDGKYFVTSSDDNTAQIWKLVKGEWQEDRVLRHDSWIEYVNFSSDGKQFVIAAMDEAIQIFNLDKGKWKKTVEIEYYWNVCSAILSPTGNYLLIISNDNDNAEIREFKTGWHKKVAIKHDGWINHACFSPDEKYLVTVSSDKTAQIWEIVKGKWKKKVTIRYSYGVTSVSFSPDGKHIVTVGDDGTAKILGLVGEEWQKKATLKHSEGVGLSNVSFSPSGDYIVTVSDDNTVKLWGLKSK